MEPRSEEMAEKSPTLKEQVEHLKKKGDKAFRDGKYEKAYATYQKALGLDSRNYDLMACLVGAALNLGYLQDVWQKAELLIQMDEQKAQGYFLKGVANDLIFAFESAIECFTKALHFEKDQPNLIIKNLIKTIAKYLDKDENFQFDDSTDLEDEDESLIKLIELVEILIDKRKMKLSLDIIEYVQSIEKKNPSVQAELMLVIGKLFKSDKNYEKALVAFEECFYLGFSMDDYGLKIKSIVLMSSCYLDMADLQKAILYYQKLIDIETSLLANPDAAELVQTEPGSTNDEIINLELRLAIRQNLYMAHLRLGKLGMCIHYLQDLIDIIRKSLKLDPDGLDLLTVEEFFEFVHVKIDAALELAKLLLHFEEFVEMQELLNKMIQFTESIIENDLLTDKQMNILRFFRIKSYAMLGICLAGVREFRNSWLASKKSLCLVEQEIEQKTSTSSLETRSSSESSTAHYLKSLQVECLIDACSALGQLKRTFKQMRAFNVDFLKAGDSVLVAHELKMLMDASRDRINLAKNAYLLSTRIIDPNLRVRSTFNLALSLYESDLYQSAAYYFSQLLTISVSLLANERPKPEDFYQDLNPDYHLEAGVYLIKCHFMMDYFQLKPSALDFDQQQLEFKTESLQDLKQKLEKSLQAIIKHILKWKLEETSRASFYFSQKSPKLNHDSKRLGKVLKIACECMIYICFKLDELNQALIFTDVFEFVTNSSADELATQINDQQLLNFPQIRANPSALIRFKLIFGCKLLYVFQLEAESRGSVAHASCLKLSQQLQDLDLLDERFMQQLFDSKLDFIAAQLNAAHNEWARSNLSEFEYRNVPVENIELEKLRSRNRLKDLKLFEHFLTERENKHDFFYQHDLEAVDLVDSTFTDALFDDALSSVDLRNLESQLASKLATGLSTDRMLDVLHRVFRKPVDSFVSRAPGPVCLVLDSSYLRMIALVFATEPFVSFTICPDSFVFYSSKLAKSWLQDELDEKELALAKQKVVSSPVRSKPVESIESSQVVVPRHTSNPKLAVSFLNTGSPRDRKPGEATERAKSRLDGSISSLITRTHTGTDAKRSPLEILPFKQLTRTSLKCTILGCPHIPAGLATATAAAFQLDKFMSSGLGRLTTIAGSLFGVGPIFGGEFTKKRLVSELESSALVFLSTLSSNESDSVLICSESCELPGADYTKHCLFDSADLQRVDLHKCRLVVLDCYSSVNHKPRITLAKKLLERGCKNVLVVLAPLTDRLMTQFYLAFFDQLKRERLISVALARAMLQVSSGGSFCVLSADPGALLDLDELHKSQRQLDVDASFARLKAQNSPEFLNPVPAVSILAPGFKSCLEKSVLELQILVKFLVNLTLSGFEKSAELVLSLNETVSKAIAIMAFGGKAKPEPLDEIVQGNTVALNILKLLGFGTHRESIYSVRDRRDRMVLFYPDKRYMDLCLRSSHVLGSIVELGFSRADNEANLRRRAVLHDLQALLPMSRRLLASLLDVLSLARFSPEIVLSLSDESVRHALADASHFCHFDLKEKDYFQWNLDHSKLDAEPVLDSARFPRTRNNPGLDFLLSIGFEVVGIWLHFSQTPLNVALLEVALKLLSSLHPDRDMSLYKEMNLNVLGQRSAALSGNRGQPVEAKEQSAGGGDESSQDLFDVQAADPWCTLVEDRANMEKKIEFVEKFKQLSAKLSKQRTEALRHHVSYVMKQSLVNKNAKVEDDGGEKTALKKVIKYKPGGGPSKSRIIVNERYKISYEEISKLREYSHFACRKNIEKINEEGREKTQRLMLPLIKR